MVASGRMDTARSPVRQAAGDQGARLIERAVGVLDARVERAESVRNAPRPISNRPMLESDRHRTERAGARLFLAPGATHRYEVTLLGVYAVNGQLGVPPRANIAETLLVVGIRVQGEKDTQHTPISPEW